MVRKKCQFEKKMASRENSRFRSGFICADSDGEEKFLLKTRIAANGNPSRPTRVIPRANLASN
jgi:hypothetical protein